MIIGVDLDDTCADLHAHWLGAYNEEHGEKYGRLTNMDMTDWGCIGRTPIGHAMYDYLDRPDFFRNLPPYPGMAAALGGLVKRGHRVVVTTACLKTQYAPQKAAWVKEHMPFVDRKDVFFGASKELLRFDAFVDDAPHNIEAYRKAWPYAFIGTIAFPYNACVKHLLNAYAPSCEDPARAWDVLGKLIRQHDRPTSANVPDED
jgi:5'-nucleotidase